MDNCEIVENTACGVAFKYCRTHKVEAHECPGAKHETTNHIKHMVDMLADAGVGFEIAPRHQAKSEFKAGGRVRCVATTQHDWESRAWTVESEVSVGDILTVSDVLATESFVGLKFVDCPFFQDSCNFEVFE